MDIVNQKLVPLLKAAVEKKVSDVHLRPNERPGFRMDGRVKTVRGNPFSAEEILTICRQFLGDSNSVNLDTVKEHDGAMDFPGICRVRYNILRFQNKVGIILRIVNYNVPSIEDLGLSDTIREIAEFNRGLTLVTGATGQGKSSTLAAMINHINCTRSSHIITIEDPVEFIHVPKKSKITQREVGVDTESFLTGLRSALRQDPDVILIGEMRDIETVDIALKAAETGHAVFATVHTTDALSTVGRILSMFKAEEQATVRERLASNLMATISQRLLNKCDLTSNKVVAQEIMMVNPGIRDCILGVNNLADIYTFIEKGYDRKMQKGSQSFDQHIKYLFEKKLITMEDARNASTSAGDFVRNLKFVDFER